MSLEVTPRPAELVLHTVLLSAALLVVQHTRRGISTLYGRFFLKRGRRQRATQTPMQCNASQNQTHLIFSDGVLGGL